MASLDIRPHSRRGSALAVAVLAALSASAFAAGLSHQLQPRSPPPFPPAQPAQPDEIAAAPPVIDPLTPAALTPPRRRGARAATEDVGASDAPPSADTATADAAAAEPDAPPAPPATDIAPKPPTEAPTGV